MEQNSILLIAVFKAKANKPAIIFSSEQTNELQTVTYSELMKMVNRVANSLRENGFSDKCGIALYMPLNVECVAAYLGIIKAGCHVISIADSYSPDEIERRIGIADGEGVITVEKI